MDSIETSAKGVKIKVTGESGEKILEAEQALVAIGFRPNSSSLGLEDIGIAMDSKGNVQIDDRQSSNIPGIWAIGDVTGKVLLAHTACLYPRYSVRRRDSKQGNNSYQLSEHPACDILPAAGSLIRTE